jgi:hypothetical protein
MKQLLHDLGINLGLSFAGFAGSLVMIGKKEFSWKKAVISIPSGVFSANYLTPIVVDGMRPLHPSSRSFAQLVSWLVLLAVP